MKYKIIYNLDESTEDIYAWPESEELLLVKIGDLLSEGIHEFRVEAR